MPNFKLFSRIILVFFTFTFGLNTLTFSQGCVAIRQMSCSSNALQGQSSDLFTLEHGKWLINLSYRYFKSFRHFRGSHEETERAQNGTEVINLSHGLDIGLSYLVSKRIMLNISLPLLYNDRSSLYEHYGNSLSANPTQARFHTYSKGIGDMRISGSYWLKNPDLMPKGNISVGLGLKLPTGNPGVTDLFHRLNSDKTDFTIERPVDQSIQLGDGAVGFSIETQGYLSIAKSTSIYYNGFYLLNPKEVNSVARVPGAVPDPNTGYFSVADQYAFRTGVNHSLNSLVNGFSVMLGGRIEGIPSDDLIGGSKGFRRPGYVVSAEPGLAYMNQKNTIMLNVPFALYRNRVKSYADKLDPSGQRHGDAAFADYLVSLSIGRWF